MFFTISTVWKYGPFHDHPTVCSGMSIIDSLISLCELTHPCHVLQRICRGPGEGIPTFDVLSHDSAPGGQWSSETYVIGVGVTHFLIVLIRIVKVSSQSRR